MAGKEGGGLSMAEAQAMFQQSLAFHRQGRFDNAEEICREILKKLPEHFDALHLSGVIAHRRGFLELAIEFIGKAIGVDPGNVAAHYHLGNVLGDLRRHQEAVGSYDRAIALKADFVEAYYNRGVALHELKRYQEAVSSFDRAIEIRSDVAAVHYSRGNALADMRQQQAAVESYDRAIGLNADYAEAYFNRGLALQELTRHQAAIDSYDRAIAIRADFAEAYYNRGNAYTEFLQWQAALESYDRAIALKPDYAESFYNRALVLQALGRHQGAIDSFKRALELKPDYEYLPGALLYAKRQICDWSGAAAQIARLAQQIDRNEKVAEPFPLLALIDSPSSQHKAAKLWVNDRHPPNLALGPLPGRPGRKKIRLGYFSSDFHNHAVAYLIAELIEKHDRDRFEIFAFSFGRNKEDEMRKRLAAGFDSFIDVRDHADKEVAMLSRAHEIDIAIDLNGFTQFSRTGIFSYRAAPLQVNYLGYVGTTGASYIDYLIADKFLIPEHCQQYFSEKIAYLPSFQANDARRKISTRIFRREELGLPETGFVYCCFNNNYKINPQTFDGWMRILKTVEGSVLYLLADNESAAANLKKQASSSGVSAQRLIFGKRIATPEYLARYQIADLFLDTLPYNAGTTASDALWAGLPVLTCMGEAFAGRMAASLLNAIDLPELVTSAQAEYEALAIQLAADPARLEKIKEKLKRNRLATPLFDSQLFTKHIEDAFSQMDERYLAGFAPEHIYVKH